MTAENFIQTEPAERQDLMLSLHLAILANDKTVTATVEPMMGKEMILYKYSGSMKYGLASAKKHMTLHILPIYGSKTLYEKYLGLLPKATFQKAASTSKLLTRSP